jgi:Ca2+-binding RTX toxin-like protein
MAPVNYHGYELAVFGQGGSDTITGGAGRDQLCGGSGNDRLHGRGEINELNGGSGNDDLYGGPDIDYLYGADGDDIIVDSGTGGFRAACSGGQQVPPSRIEAGAGNDCVQLPPLEPGWCYAQQEACDGVNVICHGGLWCGAGTDRLDTPAGNGAECETRTTGTACSR